MKRTGTRGMSSTPDLSPHGGHLPVGMSSCFRSHHHFGENTTAQCLLQPRLPSPFLLVHQHTFPLLCASFLSETATVHCGSHTGCPGLALQDPPSYSPRASDLPHPGSKHSHLSLDGAPRSPDPVPQPLQRPSMRLCFTRP